MIERLKDIDCGDGYTKTTDERDKLNEIIDFLNKTPKDEKARFKKGDEYSMIGTAGRIGKTIWRNDSFDKDALSVYNAFPTDEDAELAKDYRLKAARWAATGETSPDYDDLLKRYRAMMKRNFFL